MAKRKEKPRINLARNVPARSGDFERLFAGEADAEQSAGMQLVGVRLDAIRPDPQQPRRTFSDESLADLAESIRQDGVIQPIEVTQLGPNQFMIVHGERRWRAAKLAELTTIPAVVRRRDYDTVTRFVRQLVENIQREDLNDIERAAGLLHLRDLMQEEIAAESLATGEQSPWGTRITWAKVGKRLGYSRQRIHQLIQLLNLPDEIKEAVRQGALSERETRIYQGLKSTQQRQLHQARVRGDMTSTDLKQAAKRLKEMPEMPVAEVLREIRVLQEPSFESPSPARRPRASMAPRKNTQNLNRVHWARDHLSRIQLDNTLSSAEQQALSHLLEQLREDVEMLLAAVGSAGDE